MPRAAGRYVRAPLRARLRGSGGRPFILWPTSVSPPSVPCDITPCACLPRLHIFPDDGGVQALSDLEAGLATAPTLFAAEEFPEISEIAARRFGDEGDVAKVAELVARSDGVARTQELATSHARAAADALRGLPASSARDGMLRLCCDVLNRQA